MGKRKADSLPLLESDEEHLECRVESSEPPQSLAANRDTPTQASVADQEASNIHPFWTLLSHAGYELW